MNVDAEHLPAVGTTGEITRTVDEALLTPNYGKPDIEVLASPAVVYLMELVSIGLVEQQLPEGLTSVGTGLTFKHLRPSYQGAQVVTRATVRDVSSRRVDLTVESFEAGELVATAEHSRAVVPTANFRRPEVDAATAEAGGR